MAGLWFRAARLPEGWAHDVRIETADGVICAVQAGAAPRPGDERHGLGLTGLANLHSHAFQRAMAGTAELRGQDGDNFWTWRTRMYRLAERLRPDDLEAVAALAFAEMLESGFVRVGEFHYLHHDLDGSAFADPAEMSKALAAAAQVTGIGLTLLPVFYAHSGFGGLAPTPGQRRFVCSLDGYARLLEACRSAVGPIEDAVVGVAPHSLRAVTLAELDAVAALGGSGPIHIHVAEQTMEVEDCIAWSGQRPVEWLLSHAEVDARWCAVHATHVSGAELAGLAGSGAVTGLCPITEANLGDGIFPAWDLMARSGRFGIGSDSNVLIDAAEELRLLDYAQRLTRLERNALAAPGGATADRIYDAAQAGGRQALGAPEEALRPGAAATFISLDEEHPSVGDCPPEEALSRWIFASRGGAVDCVWRRGRKVVSGGRHVDRDQILFRYRAAMGRLRA